MFSNAQLLVAPLDLSELKRVAFLIELRCAFPLFFFLLPLQGARQFIASKLFSARRIRWHRFLSFSLPVLSLALPSAQAFSVVRHDLFSCSAD